MVVVVLFSPVEIILGFLVDACDFARSKYSACGRSSAWSTRRIFGACVVAEALQRRLEQLVSICHFPKVQEVGWPSIKEGRSTLQCTNWLFIQTTKVRGPSTMGCVFVRGYR